MFKPMMLVFATMFSTGAFALDLLVDRETQVIEVASYRDASKGMVSTLDVDRRSNTIGYFREGGNEMMAKAQQALKNAEMANLRFIRFERIMLEPGLYDLKISYGNDAAQLLISTPVETASIPVNCQ